MVMNRSKLSLDIPLPVCSDLTRAAHVNTQTHNQPISIPQVSVSLASETYNPLEPSPTHSHISLTYPIIPTKSTYPYPRTPTAYTPTHSPTLFEEFYNMAPSFPLERCSSSRSLPNSPTNTISAPFQKVIKSQSNPSLKFVFENPPNPMQPVRVKSFKVLVSPSPLSEAYTPLSPNQETPRGPASPVSTTKTPITTPISTPISTISATIPTTWTPVLQSTWTPTLPFAVQPLPCLVRPMSFVSPVN